MQGMEQFCINCGLNGHSYLDCPTAPFAPLLVTPRRRAKWIRQPRKQKKKNPEIDPLGP